MSGVIIRAIGFANGQPCKVSGQYVKAFDPDAYDGLGAVDFTADPARAKRFANHADAWEFWRTQSKVKPLREDGRPNRPLTSTTVQMLVVR
jgi:hypothetical protein